MPIDTSDLIERVRRGEVRAAARLCRLVDDQAPEAEAVLDALERGGPVPWVIGVTGNPGAGKSSLVSALVRRFRAAGKRVAVIAIDPSSPFAAGALLGDRVRMQEHFEDENVFIRSVATRGALGGLSRTAPDLITVLAAWGAEVVFLETVGVGQDEVDVAWIADTTVVVVVPGLGDDVQASKAGLLECGDVFVVNKADRPGSESVVRDLEMMIALGADAHGSAGRDVIPTGGGHGATHGAASWSSEAAELVFAPPPVVTCSATTGLGLDDFEAALLAHRDRLDRQGEAALIDRTERRLRLRVRDAFLDRMDRELRPAIETAAHAVARGERTMREALSDVLSTPKSPD